MFDRENIGCNVILWNRNLSIEKSQFTDKFQCKEKLKKKNRMLLSKTDNLLCFLC